MEVTLTGIFASRFSDIADAAGDRFGFAIYCDFFQPGFSWIRITACVSLGMLFIILLPLLLRALSRRPAIEINNDIIKLYAIGWKSFRISDIEEIRPPVSGSATMKVFGKSVTIPLSLYRNSSEAWKKIKAIQP